jgi:glycogen(starch) synthase
MRILVITSYYPPSRLGWGYMQLCEEVTDWLATRGHHVTVLTSTYRDGPEIARSYDVHRVLDIDPDWNEKKSAAWQFFVERQSRERRAIARFKEVTGSLQPDIIFIWDAIGLPRALLQAAERYASATTVYYFANYLPELPDEYIAYWQQEPARFIGKLTKVFLGRLALEQLRREGKPVPLQYSHAICVSHYVRQRFVSRGLIPDSAVVIHNGVDLSAFVLPRAGFSAVQSDRLSCLVAGRVVPDKGVHTVIDAFGLLSQREETRGQASLTILGDGPADYMQHLRQRATTLGINNIVDFMAPVPREQMPEVLSRHDVLIVSSEYGEPIARSMQEGMAMGLLVIGTTTGGSGELLQHEHNGLVFAAADAQSLATQIARAGSTPGLGARLARQGQEDVRANFDIRLTAERIEAYLAERCA